MPRKRIEGDRREAIATADEGHEPREPDEAGICYLSEEEREAADDRREIEIGADEARVADETIAVLATRARDLFQRGGELVRPIVETQKRATIARPADAPRIVSLTRANLRELISRHVVYQRIDGRDVAPPDAIVRAIHERSAWERLPPLHAIVHAPIVRPDGSIARRGYDRATGVFVAFDAYDEERIEHACDADLTRDDAARARDELVEVVADFPFEKPVHRSAWLAALLTCFARHAFEGVVPLVLVDKNVRGCGGTLLTDAIGKIATGRPLPRTVAAKDAEEDRKRITSIAKSGDSIVLIDNVAGTLGNDAFDAALTSTTWRDRALGTNTMCTLPLHVQWIASGNNVHVGGDTLRRTLPIRLVSPDERPEERTGFQHPNLLAWIGENRTRLVAAALTILRAHALAGRPAAAVRPWGSFEGWSATVRSALVWAGEPDPAAAREELVEAADAEANALADLLRAWRRQYGEAGATVTAVMSKLAASVKDDPLDFSGEHVEIARPLAELVPSRPGTLPSAHAVGKKLSAMRDRVVGGLAFEGRKGNAGVVWVAREVRRAGDDGDDGDDVSPPVKKEQFQERGKHRHQSHHRHSEAPDAAVDVTPLALDAGHGRAAE